MEYIKADGMVSLVNPGVTSKQILNPENSASERVTVTEVHLQTGAEQPRHSHPTSEQIWYALNGTGKLLLANGEEKTFCAGDAVRFADGDEHGLRNDGSEEFVYLSVTSPPIDFGYAYKERK